MSESLIQGPTRFDKDPEWAMNAGKSLRLVTRGGSELTDYDRQRVRSAVMKCDRLGADLARAILEEKTVTMGEFQRALKEGIDVITDAHPALVAFFDAATSIPSWYDADRAERGAAVTLRSGMAGVHVLETASLMAGYTSSATTRQLAATDRLVSDVGARIAETARWWFEVIQPGGMQVGRDGWQLTVHIRLVHAMVNHQLLTGALRPPGIESDWDVDDWGMPVCQADQAATLGLFSTTFVLALRGLGMPISANDGRDLMHFWRYVGWVMGVDEEWLVDNEQQARRNMLAIASFSPAPDDYSKILGRALYKFWGAQNFRYCQRIQRRILQSYLLSIQRAVVGRRGLVDLGLPSASLWAVPVSWLLYLPPHAAARFSPRVRSWLTRRSRKRVSSWLSRHETMTATRSHADAR